MILPICEMAPWVGVPARGAPQLHRAWKKEEGRNNSAPAPPLPPLLQATTRARARGAGGVDCAIAHEPHPNAPHSPTHWRARHGAACEGKGASATPRARERMRGRDRLHAARVNANSRVSRHGRRA